MRLLLILLMTAVFGMVLSAMTATDPVGLGENIIDLRPSTAPAAPATCAHEWGLRWQQIGPPCDQPGCCVAHGRLVRSCVRCLIEEPY